MSPFSGPFALSKKGGTHEGKPYGDEVEIGKMETDAKITGKIVIDMASVWECCSCSSGIERSAKSVGIYVRSAKFDVKAVGNIKLTAFSKNDQLKIFNNSSQGIGPKMTFLDVKDHEILNTSFDFTEDLRDLWKTDWKDNCGKGHAPFYP